MTKYICAICKKESHDAELIFEHITEIHGDIIEREYIIEDNDR